MSQDNDPKQNINIPLNDRCLWTDQILIIYYDNTVTTKRSESLKTTWSHIELFEPYCT